MLIFQHISIMLSMATLVCLFIIEWRTERWRRADRERRCQSDATKRRALQDAQASLASETAHRRRLHGIFNATRDSILVFMVDKDCTPSCFCDANANACQLLEYEKSELLKLTPMSLELVRAPDIQRLRADVDLISLNNSETLPSDSVFALRLMQRMIRNAINEGTCTYESSFVTRSGRRLPVEITATALASEDPPMIIYTAADTTARRRMETARRESEQRFSDFFNASLTGAALYDAQHRLINVNTACLRIFGCPHKDEFEKLDLFKTAYIPQTIHDRVSRGDNVSGEEVFDLDNLISAQGFVSNRRGKASLEFFFQNLGCDSDRNPVGHLVHIKDITELRETESALQVRESQLRQSQKMEAIGTMTSGIAHDFNNILTPILGYAEIGLEICDKSSRLFDFIKEIRISALRAKELTQQILVFSRQSSETTTQIHLAPIIKEVAKQQASSLPGNITVNYAIRTDTDLALANPTQIHQILTNFATNAAYAMRESGGLLDIQLSSFTMGWRHRHEFPQLKKGSYLRITVRDTGSGIPENIRNRVFDPFFSTKPTGEGTGMGLAVVKGIVDTLGGCIALESKEGEGSAFHVALPLVDAPPVEESINWQAPGTGNHRILFVDDEVNIVKMATPMLESLGYRSVVCSGSRKALETFLEAPDTFDLLISDQVMPEMTGSELAAEVRKIKPALPVIICSGFSGSFTVETASSIGINAFLQKPITRRELGQAIASVLEKPSEPVTPPDYA